MPRGYKDPRFAHLKLPDLSSFAKSERERKLLAMTEGRGRDAADIVTAFEALPARDSDVSAGAIRRVFAGSIERLNRAMKSAPKGPSSRRKAISTTSTACP